MNEASFVSPMAKPKSKTNRPLVFCISFPTCEKNLHRARTTLDLRHPELSESWPRARGSGVLIFEFSRFCGQRAGAAAVLPLQAFSLNARPFSPTNPVKWSVACVPVS